MSSLYIATNRRALPASVCLNCVGSTTEPASAAIIVAWMFCGLRAVLLIDAPSAAIRSRRSRVVRKPSRGARRAVRFQPRPRRASPQRRRKGACARRTLYPSARRSRPRQGFTDVVFAVRVVFADAGIKERFRKRSLVDYAERVSQKSAERQPARAVGLIRVVMRAKYVRLRDDLGERSGCHRHRGRWRDERRAAFVSRAASDARALLV